jgi:hypothetical protein
MGLCGTVIALCLAPDAGAILGPKAPKGEPPIIEERNEFADRTVFQQYFDLPDRVSPEFGGSIADRYRLLGERPDNLPPHTLTIACPIRPDGRIDPPRCESDEASGPDGKLAFRAAVSARALDGLPSFSVLKVKDGRAPPYYRHVRFKLQTPEVRAAGIDFQKGRLVEVGQVPELVSDLGAEVRRRDYPARAMRENREGAGTVECQIQTDLSIACHMLTFAPAENSQDFFAEPIRYLAGKFAMPRLQNGEDARGVRVRFPIRWSIPR